jgi:hypothetical protein
MVQGMTPPVHNVLVLQECLDEQERICLYHQAAIFRIDRTNELHLSVKDDKIVVYLINEKDKGSIQHNRLRLRCTNLQPLVQTVLILQI